VFLPPALATGKLKIVTGAMAREVNTDRAGLATGVSYVDVATGREMSVRSKVVVLAASACESARLLLNSKSPRHPNGLANGSGAVGRYLTDTPGSRIRGYIPALANLPAHNEDGAGGLHLYMPWWLDNRKLDFPRGYHFEFGGGRNMPGYGFMGGIHRVNGGGYGRKLKEDYRRYYGSFVSFAPRGEMIPNAGSYCELDPEAVDRYGIPILRFHWKWSEYETLQMRHAHVTAREIIEKMGGKVIGDMPTRDEDYGIQPGGEIIHEAGTTRMGESASTSVLNGNGQAHEVKNLFVADAGPFVTNPHKNATWTIMALAWRTADFIAAESRKGAL
jgi:choline dehydrogenase-like flavoprotein